MKNLQKKNLHLIPTDKPSRLWTNNLRRRLELDEFPEQHLNQIAKHIYITSNEEIKNGDWIKWGEAIYKANKKYTPPFKKIILTTDVDLIKDGVQAIDDEFLEWFVVNPSCESVEVDLVSVNEFGSEITVNGYGFDKFIYKITIPKEEPTEEAKQRAKNYMSLKGALEPKQETLEEAAERILLEEDLDLSDYDKRHILKTMVNIAKWQQEQDNKELAMWKLAVEKQEARCMALRSVISGLQERMYSEEDMEEAFTNGLNRSFDSDFDRWFEQFKKK